MTLYIILTWYIIALILSLLVFFVGWRNTHGKLKRYDMTSSLWTFFFIFFLPILIIVFTIPIMYKNRKNTKQDLPK